MTNHLEHAPESSPSPRVPVPHFELGALVATPGALAALAAHNTQPHALVERHVRGDWGTVPLDDAQANDAAVRSGGRLLSSYTIASGTKIWVITEADRSSTTLLLPSEY